MQDLLRFLAVVGLAFIAGCSSNLDLHELVREINEPADAVKTLGVAVEAFRLGSGRWPRSADELRASQHLEELVRFDRYENLRFEPVEGGGIAIKFDRWTGREGGPVMKNVTLELSQAGGSGGGNMEVPASREEFEALQEMGFLWDWTLPKLVDERTVTTLRAACEADAEVECQGPAAFRGVYVDGARRFVVFESTVVSDRAICYEYDTLARRFTRKFRLPMV